MKRSGKRKIWARAANLAACKAHAAAMLLMGYEPPMYVTLSIKIQKNERLVQTPLGCVRKKKNSFVS